MAKAIKRLRYMATATAVLLLALALASTAGAAAAQMDDDTPRAYALRGQISNVQLDSDGNPEWVQSGYGSCA